MRESLAGMSESAKTLPRRNAFSVPDRPRQVLVIADLTQGSGRFNLALGAITTAVGIGASLSQAIAGGLVHHFGYHVGFLFLAAVALAALVILYLWMPETRDLRGAPAARASR
jgi:MFS family permease